VAPFAQGPFKLEIESFYLFAKIYLGKIALFLQDYFGHSQKEYHSDRMTN
jgi:hypothetical protein